MGEVPVKGVHHGAVPSELFKGERRDELGGVFGHNHLYLAVLFDQGGGQGGGLKGGNAACDPEKDCFSAEHGTKTSFLGWIKCMIWSAQGASMGIMTQTMQIVKELVHICKVLENLSLAIGG